MTKRGPKTPEGKAVVRLNAVRHGVFASDPVIPGVEDPEEWQQFRDLIVGDIDPVGAVEEMLAERVADCAWRMRRIASFEAGVIAARLERVPHDFGTPEYDRRYFYMDKPRSLAEARENVRVAREFVQLLEELHALPLIELVSKECMGALREALDALDYDDGVIESLLGGDDEDAKVSDEGWNVTLLLRLLRRLEEEGAGSVAAIEKYARATALRTEDELEYVIGEQDRMRRERLLPDAAGMRIINRYEAGLTRRMHQALHELAFRRARRDGQRVALARIGVHAEAPDQSSFATAN